jgi:hypothetical protein
VGGVVGGVAAGLLLVIAALVLRRCLRRRRADPSARLGDAPPYEDIAHGGDAAESIDVAHGGGSDVPPPDYRSARSSEIDRTHDPTRSLRVVGARELPSGHPREPDPQMNRKRIRALPAVPPPARLTNPPLSYASMSSSSGSHTHVGLNSPVRDGPLAWKGAMPSAKEDHARKGAD